MGRGIAQAAASFGCSVRLVDVSREVLDDAMSEIARNLKSEVLMGRGREVGPSQILARISCGVDLEDLRDADFAIENVVELTEVKRAVHASLGRILRPDSVLAANSSTFPIAEIAGYTTHPERVVGLHFMNPAQSKKVVEVISGPLTSDATIRASLTFLERIGKSGILVKDAVGFVSNRILMLTVNEAIKTVELGIASAEDVDRIFVGCFGHQMGPLATADLIGLDTILLSLVSLRDRLADGKYEPAELLKRHVEKGFLGRKSKRGFFDYM